MYVCFESGTSKTKVCIFLQYVGLAKNGVNDYYGIRYICMYVCMYMKHTGRNLCMFPVILSSPAVGLMKVAMILLPLAVSSSEIVYIHTCMHIKAYIPNHNK
jgi:hypothetical protein